MCPLVWQYLAQTQAAVREASISNHAMHRVDAYVPQRAAAPTTPTHSVGGTAGLQQLWSAHHMGHAVGKSTQGLGLHTHAAAAPLSAVSAEIGTYGPYSAPPAGRHLSSVGLGGGASTAVSGSAQGSSFDGSNGVLLGEYISSLDASTSVV